jgi:hypothetical protein
MAASSSMTADVLESDSCAWVPRARRRWPDSGPARGWLTDADLLRRAYVTRCAALFLAELRDGSRLACVNYLPLKRHEPPTAATNGDMQPAVRGRLLDHCAANAPKK